MTKKMTEKQNIRFKETMMNLFEQGFLDGMIKQLTKRTKQLGKIKNDRRI